MYGQPVQVIHRGETMVIEQPTMVPTATIGYHGGVLTDSEAAAAHSVYRALVARGIAAPVARAMVARAIARQQAASRAGLGQAELFGKGQAYYNALTAAQNRAIAINAEINGIGKAAWNKTMLDNRAAFAAAGWAPAENYLFDNMTGFWINQIKRLLTTAQRVPPEADINDVQRLAAGSEKMITMVKGYLPREVTAQAEADRADIEGRLKAMGPLTSPGDVARKTLVEEIEKGVKGLLGGGLVLAAVAAAIALGLYAAFGRR